MTSAHVRRAACGEGMMRRAIIPFNGLQPMYPDPLALWYIAT
jgi:hypothetical protein